MNAYRTWKSTVDFWAAMAQAPAVVTLRMMNMTRRRATRRAEPVAGPRLASLETPAATVVPFARAEAAPEPVGAEPAVAEAEVAEHVPAEILAEASPVALLAATEPVKAKALADEAAPFAEEAPEEALAVLAEPEAPKDLVEAAISPMLEEQPAPALAEAVAAPSAGRRPAPRRGTRTKRV